MQQHHRQPHRGTMCRPDGKMLPTSYGHPQSSDTFDEARYVEAGPSSTNLFQADGSETDSGTYPRQLYLVQLAPKNTQNGVRVRKLRPLTHPALTVLPWYCNKPFTTAEESMNLGCAGASKAQERVQNLAHGHPRGVGCSLTVVVLSLVHAGS